MCVQIMPALDDALSTCRFLPRQAVLFYAAPHNHGVPGQSPSTCDLVGIISHSVSVQYGVHIGKLPDSLGARPRLKLFGRPYQHRFIVQIKLYSRSRSQVFYQLAKLFYFVTIKLAINHGTQGEVRICSARCPRARVRFISTPATGRQSRTKFTSRLDLPSLRMITIFSDVCGRSL